MDALKLSYQQFFRLSKVGRIGYDPRGEVLSDQQVEELKTKYIRSQDSYRFGNVDARMHLEMGRAYGYNTADLCAFLSRRVMLDLEKQKGTLDEYLPRTGFDPRVCSQQAIQMAYKWAVDDGVIESPRPLNEELGAGSPTISRLRRLFDQGAYWTKRLSDKVRFGFCRI